MFRLSQKYSDSVEKYSFLEPQNNELPFIILSCKRERVEAGGLSNPYMHIGPYYTSYLYISC